jgi:hypothetical protein
LCPLLHESPYITGPADECGNSLYCVQRGLCYSHLLLSIVDRITMAHGGEIVGKLSSILDLALGIRKVASKPGAKQSAYECTALAGHIGEVVSWAEERSEWIEYPELLTRLDNLQRSVHYVLSIQFEH